LLQTVVASGRVETPHRVDIGAQITGTVAHVPVSEGQTVKAGDVLVELVSAELRSAKRHGQHSQQQLHAMQAHPGPKSIHADHCGRPHGWYR
jgi:HlyD family secretion protein